jgi:hypothetical protein
LAVRASQGSVSFTGLLLLVAIVVGVYCVVIFAPAVTDNMDVQEAMDVAVNNSEKTDDWIQRMVLDKLRYVGTHMEDDGFGNQKEVQGLGFAPEDVIVERDNVANTINVHIDYTREVELKPFHKMVKLNFHPSKSGQQK